jgi:hypothetical protein
MNLTHTYRPRSRYIRAVLVALILALAVLAQGDAQLEALKALGDGGSAPGAVHSSNTANGEPTDDYDWYFTGDAGAGGG